ncbi:RHS repeat-associated core domain-containing protein [Variovorax sp. YR750]|uniref:RHS repeat-associated core domain-containing protein n=1 Tax=Variovorax sp. YR750 TaxID=1884384 RepID=UPI0008D47657|nr:RHS repeat-associated core domain-containing protein [Variovorax sp. YR750]SEM41438.1 RHS repeat-associated core domain-containing protein [Variovorax sp. YR750]
MSGKPAARISDSVSGGKVVSGSGTVLIGSQGGVACSECPGGVTVGNPVSPSLGAKVLMGEPELDFALPGAMPLVWQRQYSSYVNPEHGAPCGPLGHGWTLPGILRMEAGEEACRLITGMGRVVTFDALPEGGSIYSPSEDLWLLRGANRPGDAAWTREARFRRVLAEFGADPHSIVVTNGQAQTFWVLQAAQTHSEASAGTHYLLCHQQDRFGRCQSFQRDEFDRVTGIVDGVGRRYRLSWRQVHAPVAAQGLWHADCGWRLTGIELAEDPLVTDPAESVMLVRYSYSPDGDLLTVHDRAGRLVREFAWQRHLMVGHRYLGGPRHTYRYESLDPGARVVEHFNEEGLNYRFDYELTPTGRQTRVVDSLRRVEVYRFEGEGGLSRLVEQVRADGSRLGYAYDAAGRLVEAIDPLGAVTRLRYDGQGRALGSQAPDGGHSLLEYDEATGLLVQTVDAAGRATWMEHDEWGRLTRVTRPNGHVERREYPSPEAAPLTCEYPILLVDAKGGATRLAWSATGQLIRRTDCSGRTSEAQFNARGLTMQQTDALGQTTRYEYDAAGHLAAVHHPDGGTTRYRRDTAGRIVRILLREKGAEQDIGFAYDLWGRVTQRWQRGLEVRFAYDEAGRLVRLTNENGAVSRFAWDAMDRLVEERGFDGRRQAFHYDAAGRLVEASDGRDRDELRTRYLWDALGRLSEIRVPATAHSSARIERLQWNAAGQLMATRSHLRDGESDEAGPLLAEALIERDAAGHLVAETQRVYDLAPLTPGKPTGSTIAFEHIISHTLDPLGNREASLLQDVGRLDYLMYGAGYLHGLLHNGRGVLDIERDGLHREIRRRLLSPSGSSVLEVQRQWDPRGRARSLDMAGLQRRDAAGEGAPVSLVGQLTQRRYDYDDIGQLTAIRSPGGDTLFRHDAAGRLIGAAGMTSAERRWRFDPAGNRLPSLDDTRLQFELAHDDNGWAAEVRSRWRDQDFDLLNREEPRPSTARSLAGIVRWHDNRVGHGDDAVFAYDSRGNRVQSLRRDGRRLVLRYDGANRLVESHATEADGSVIVSRHLYDVHGRRLTKTVSEQTPGKAARESRTFYGWDGDHLVHVEHWSPESERQVVHTVYEPGSFTPLVQFSAAGGATPTGLAALAAQARDPRMQQALHEAFDALPLDMRERMDTQVRQMLRDGLPASAQALEALPVADDTRSVAVRHYHCDYLGTPQALTDERGRLVWMGRCDPWGNLLQEFNPRGISQPIRLPGQHYDAETGLCYNRHRHYDPDIGSYVNQDPIGLTGGIALFSYAQQNPVQFSDPMGLYAYAGTSTSGLDGAPVQGPLSGGAQNCPDCVQVADAKSTAAACLVGIFLIFGLPTGGRTNFPAPPPRPVRVEQVQEPKKCV